MSERKTTRAFVKARDAFKTKSRETKTPCWICGLPIDYEAPSNDHHNDDRFELDHIRPVSTHPDMQHDPTNWAPSHAGCNRERGDRDPRPSLGTPSRQWT